MSKTNIARLARNGACGSFSVMRTVCEPTASTLETIDLSSNPPNCASQSSKVWPALTWLSCCGLPAFHQRSKFQTTLAASSGVPSWNRTLRRSWNVQTRPSPDTSHRSASAGSTSVVAPLYLTSPSKTCRVMRDEIPSVMIAGSSCTGSPWAPNTKVWPSAEPTVSCRTTATRSVSIACRIGLDLPLRARRGETTRRDAPLSFAHSVCQIPSLRPASGERRRPPVETHGVLLYPVALPTRRWNMSGLKTIDRILRQAVESTAMPGVVAIAAAGQPLLRPPKRSITLRHLLTHTAGFGYEIWDPAVARYQTVTGTPGVTTCTNAALTTPLMFDPGDRWEYGISIDWVGKMVEAAGGQKLDRYFQENIFGPLGMKDTSFRISPSQRERLASVHQRGADGALTPVPFEVQQDPEFLMGGGGLYGTAPDYLAFAYMIMQGGTFKGAQVLRPETVALMAQHHLGALDIGVLRSTAPTLSNDVELFPRMPKGWGLSFLINTQPAPTGRAAGSLAWAGLANTYFWIDRAKRVCGVFLSQVFPFYDRTAIDLFEKFETEVYRAL